MARTRNHRREPPARHRLLPNPGVWRAVSGRGTPRIKGTKWRLRSRCAPPSPSGSST